MLLLFLNLTALLFLIRHRQTRAKVPVPIVLSISRSSYLRESSPGGVVVWLCVGRGGAEEEEELPAATEEEELPLRPNAAKWLVIPAGGGGGPLVGIGGLDAILIHSPKESAVTER